MTQKAIIVHNIITKYRNTSWLGNPSRFVDGVTEHGDVFRGYTAPNATCGYSCENWTGKTAKLIYHVTRSGNRVIDYIRDVK